MTDYRMLHTLSVRSINQCHCQLVPLPEDTVTKNRHLRSRFCVTVSSRAASRGHSYEESTRRATSRGHSYEESRPEEPILRNCLLSGPKNTNLLKENSTYWSAGAESGVSGSCGESGRRLGIKNPKIPIRRPHEIKDAYKHANGKGRFFGQISRTDGDLFEFFLRKRSLSVGEIWAQKSGFAAGISSKKTVDLKLGPVWRDLARRELPPRPYLHARIPRMT